jgi:hypothetical protein
MLQDRHVTGLVLPFGETSDFASQCSAQVHIPKNALDTAEGSVEG